MRSSSPTCSSESRTPHRIAASPGLRRKGIAALALTIVFLSSATAPRCGKPVIGLIYSKADYLRYVKEDGDPQQPYRDAIEDNGGDVLVLSQTYSPEVLDWWLSRVDGILLPGGIDVAPKFYGEQPHEHLGEVDVRLDELEFRVLAYARDHRLPVLAICRGEQVLNVFYGGSLIQDIPSQYTRGASVKHRFTKEADEPHEHAINVESGSILRELLGADRIAVNSSHHQAVEDLAPRFVVTARADDGIVEAIEYVGEPFMLGVQFHPEGLRTEDARFDTLFARFVKKATARRERHLRRCGMSP